MEKYIKKTIIAFALALIMGGMLPGGVWARWSPDANQRKAERKFLRTGKVEKGFQPNGKGGIMPIGYEIVDGQAVMKQGTDPNYPGDPYGAYRAAVQAYYDQINELKGLTYDEIIKRYWIFIPGHVDDITGQYIPSHYEEPPSGIIGSINRDYNAGDYAGFYAVGEYPNAQYYPIGYSSSGGDGDGGGRSPVYPTFPPLPTWTPTPTPTPTTAPMPWSKIKDSSFMGPLAYDSDDTTQPYFIVGEGGPVMSAYIGLTGLNASARPNASNWQSVYESTGFYNDTMGFENFTTYVKARKTYKSISSLSEIDGDGIYLWEGLEAFEVAEVPDAFDQYNVVFVSTAPITINVTGAFAPTKSVAILASSISFAPTVTEARGIFIGSQIATGETTDQGLKIEGNLIAKDNMVNGRRWSNLSRPALFIVLKPEMYTDLLAYLSVANYEWEQKQ